MCHLLRNEKTPGFRVFVYKYSERLGLVFTFLVQNLKILGSLLPYTLHSVLNTFLFAFKIFTFE